MWSISSGEALICINLRLDRNSSLGFVDVGHGNEVVTVAPWEAVYMMSWGLDREASSGTVIVVDLYAWKLLCSVEIFCLKPRMMFGFDTMLNINIDVYTMLNMLN